MFVIHVWLNLLANEHNIFFWGKLMPAVTARIKLISYAVLGRFSDCEDEIGGCGQSAQSALFVYM